MNIRSKLFFVMLAPLFLFAQTSEEKLIEKQRQDKERAEQLKKEFLEINGNLYKVNANYLNFGVGLAYLPVQGHSAVNVGVGYNFRYRHKFYKAGVERTDNISFFGTSPIYFTEIFLATGKRFPSKKSHLSYYYGGAFYSFNDLSNTTNPVKRGVGLYGEASAYIKPLYDIGIGATGFANLNIHAPVIGMRLEFYFSGAYRGKKKD